MIHNKREVLFKESFEQSLKRGVDTLANAVKVTMGPKGKLVMIQREKRQQLEQQMKQAMEQLRLQFWPSLYLMKALECKLLDIKLI